MRAEHQSTCFFKKKSQSINRVLGAARETVFSSLIKKNLLMVWSSFLRRSASQICVIKVSLHLNVCISVLLFLNLTLIFPSCLSLQITKQQLQQTKDRFQAFLNGDTQIVADEAFINAVQSYTEVPATLSALRQTGHALCALSGFFSRTVLLLLLPSCCFPSPSCEQTTEC